MANPTNPTTPPTPAAKPTSYRKRTRQPICVHCRVAYATKASPYGHCMGCHSSLEKCKAMARAFGFIVVKAKAKG